jgi:ATP-dependent DNA ligase
MSSKKITSYFKSNPPKKRVSKRGTSRKNKIDPFRYKPMLLSEDSTNLGKEGLLWEYKEDGTRLMTTLTKNDIWLITTTGIDKSIVLPEVQNIGKGLNFKENIVLDVEGVVLKDGVSDYPSAERRFNRQNPLTQERAEELTEKYPVTLIAFDILELDGKDLTNLPLIERKRILHQVFEGNTNPHIQMVKSYDYTDAKKLLKNSYDLKLEGIVGKKLDSIYHAKTDLKGWVKKRGEFKTTRDWVKEKTTSMMDAFIPAYIYGTGKVEGLIGSFLLACYDKKTGNWRYVGKVGTGWNREDLKKLTEELEKIPTTTKKFEGINAERIKKKKGREIIFIDPKHYKDSKIMRVRFMEYTPNLIMRMSVYEGLRDDIDIVDTHLEFRKFPPHEIEQIKVGELVPIDWNTYEPS